MTSSTEKCTMSLPIYVVHALTKRFSVLSRLTLREAALNVLNTSDVEQKAIKTMDYVKSWRDGGIYQVTNEYADHLECPSEPCRPMSNDAMIPVVQQNADVDVDSDEYKAQVEIETKKIKTMYKKITVECTVHAIANAESYAVDLFWDLIARYTSTSIPTTTGTTSITLPREFYENMTYIANQEAEHFLSWFHRLREMGYPFGTFPLSKGLWQSAGDTSGDLAYIYFMFFVVYVRSVDNYIQFSGVIRILARRRVVYFLMFIPIV